MGTYEIPRNLRGESRILYIFSVKSLITTGIGLFVGLVFYLLFGMILGIGSLGVAFIVIFSLLGFAIGTFKIPTIVGLDFTKKIGGESLDEIIRRYFLFRKNKKMYIYTKEEE